MEGRAGSGGFKMGSAPGCPARKAEWLGAFPDTGQHLHIHKTFTGDFKHAGVCLRDRTDFPLIQDR